MARTKVRKYFRIHKNDAGTEAFTDEYVHELEAEVKRLREENKSLVIQLHVVDGTSCAEEQQAGNGPCGICLGCLREKLEQRDRVQP